MSLFLVQYRSVKHIGGVPPSDFPALVIATIGFGPEDAFGLSTPYRTTAIRAHEASVNLNLQEGVASFDGPLLGTSEAEFQVQGVAAKIQGNALVIRGCVPSLQNAYAWLTSMNAILPALMSHKFSVFVWIKTFEARIGEEHYRVDSSTLRYSITTSTVEERITEVKSCIEGWLGCRHERHLRMYSAFYYLDMHSV